MFAETVLTSQEVTVACRDVVTHASFPELGITDASFFLIAGNPALVLTTDFELAQRLAAEDLPAINFNHIRTAYWP